MLRHRLTDEQWNLIADLFASTASTGRPPRDRRQVLDGILWILNTGSPWRDLPEQFGAWNSVFRRFSRWSRKGVWQRIFDALSADPDFEYLILDSTIVRAHQHAAGARKRVAKADEKGGPPSQTKDLGGVGAG